MRTADLGRTAAQAEVLRIKRLAKRQVNRAIWGAVAAVFLIAVLVMVHVLAYDALLTWVAPVWGAVILLAVDLLMALLFGSLALRNKPDAVEAEARTIRDQALAEMRESVAISALMSPLTRVAVRSAGRKNLLGMTLAALATTFLAKSRK